MDTPSSPNSGNGHEGSVRWQATPKGVTVHLQISTESCYVVVRQRGRKRVRALELRSGRCEVDDVS